jgi:phage tail sheath protein FI
MASIPSYPGVHLRELPSGTQTIAGASTSVAAFVGYLPEGPHDKAVRVFSFAEFSRHFGGLDADSETSYAVRQFFLNGGAEAWIVRVNLNGASPGESNWATKKSDFVGHMTSAGLPSLATLDPESFNILCLPDAVQLTAAPAGNASADDGHALATTLYTAAANFCDDQDAFLLVDPPGDMDASTLTTWADTLRRKNAATYFPTVDIADPLDGHKARAVGPSGTLAGLYARIDASRGIWKAPAGTEAKLRGAEPSSFVGDGQNGVLNSAGINVLRTFAGYGPISWGARTLVGHEEGDNKYVPVRRMTLFLKKSLELGLKWAVFEPNGEKLWATIRLTVESFLNRLYRQGAFKGATTSEAYFVLCDSTTTTADDINLGMVNVVVGFAPLKPAEFVVVQLQQIAGQAGS